MLKKYHDHIYIEGYGMLVFLSIMYFLRTGVLTGSLMKSHILMVN